MLHSCDKEIEIKLPEPDENLIVSGLLNPDSLITVNLGETAFITDSIQNEINDADVSLYINGLFTEKLSEISSGKYQSLTNFASERNIYEIQINTDKYGISSAVDTVPVKINLINLSLSHVLGTNIYGRAFSDIQLSFNDNMDKQNYYEIFLLENFTFDFIGQTGINGGLASWFSDEISIKEENDDADNRVGNYKSILLSDKYFNGEHLSLKLYFLLPNINNNGEPVIPDDYKLYVVFNSVSRQYFEYMKKVRLAKNSNNDLWNVYEPVTVKGNINNGIGLFAGYSSLSDSIFWHVKK